MTLTGGDKSTSNIITEPTKTAVKHNDDAMDSDIGWDVSMYNGNSMRKSVVSKTYRSPTSSAEASRGQGKTDHYAISTPIGQTQNGSSVGSKWNLTCKLANVLKC